MDGTPTSSGDSDVLVLLPDPSQVRRARRYVFCACDSSGVASTACDTAVLLTSEAVTNAFLHGRSEARVRVVRLPGRIRIEVADDNSRRPVFASADQDALGGRGIALLEELAADWGVRDEAYGKTVWFEVAA